MVVEVDNLKVVEDLGELGRLIACCRCLKLLENELMMLFEREELGLLYTTMMELEGSVIL